jgi:hypothetical protein
VIIGLNLGTTSSAQLKSLVIVLIFHQAFEGKPLAPLFICSYHPNPPFSSFCPPDHPKPQIFLKEETTNYSFPSRSRSRRSTIRHRVPEEI